MFPNTTARTSARYAGGPRSNHRTSVGRKPTLASYGIRGNQLHLPI